MTTMQSDGTFEYAVIAAQDARPGDIIYWATSTGTRQIADHGKVLEVIPSLPTVLILFTALVRAQDSTDTDRILFTGSDQIGIVRSHARV